VCVYVCVCVCARVRVCVKQTREVLTFEMNSMSSRSTSRTTIILALAR